MEEQKEKMEEQKERTEEQKEQRKNMEEKIQQLERQLAERGASQVRSSVTWLAKAASRMGETLLAGPVSASCSGAREKLQKSCHVTDCAYFKDVFLECFPYLAHAEAAAAAAAFPRTLRLMKTAGKRKALEGLMQEMTLSALLADALEQYFADVAAAEAVARPASGAGTGAGAGGEAVRELAEISAVHQMACRYGRRPYRSACRSAWRPRWRTWMRRLGRRS